MPDYTEAKRWIRLAQRDDNVATHLYDTLIPMPVETICFHCQQAVEKALKAILAYHEEDVPKTHNIRILAELCKTHSTKVYLDDKVVDTITAFAVVTRYADDNRDFTEDTAKFALRQAKQTVKNVVEALEQAELEQEEKA